MEVISRVSDIDSIYNTCSNIPPDVIMLSPESAGFCPDAVAPLTERATVIIIVSKNMPEISLGEVLNIGINGILSTCMSADSFIQGVQNAVKGDFSMPMELAGLPAGISVSKAPKQFSSPLLADREDEIPELFYKGLTNLDILITLCPVKTHTIC